MNPPERRWLKVTEAAHYLSINPKTLYAILSKGGLHHVKRQGVGIRIDRTRLDEFMLEGEIPSIREQIGERK